MFHSSLTSAITEATPLACRALLSQGVKFVVAVENAKGEWFLLHADDQGHAGTLARDWVENMGARGASCRRIFADGIAPKPFLTVYEQCGFEDDAA
jgi:hypothetical protein